MFEDVAWFDDSLGIGLYSGASGFEIAAVVSEKLASEHGRVRSLAVYSIHLVVN